MAENNMQVQIDGINQKLDILLEEMRLQKENREQWTDLAADLSIVGKEAFKATVDTLDKSGVELDQEALIALIMKGIRNIHMLNDLFDMMESAYDFMKDAGPIVKQIGLDTTDQFNKLDQKGYIDFFKESSQIVDQIVTNFTKEDVRHLAENIVMILNTLKNMTQPQMLKSLNNAVSVYQHIETDNIPEYSMWKAFRELQKPELKKGLGFIITFLKNLASENGKSNLVKLN